MTYTHTDGKQYGTGAVVRSPIHRFLRRAFSKKLAGAGQPYNWTTNRKPVTVPIKNQMSSFSCGGQAGSYLVGDIRKEEVSAKSIYSPIAYPQGGTTVPSLINQLTLKGSNLESDVKSYYTNGNCDEPLMTSTAWETPVLLSNALTRAVYKAVHVAMDMESIAQAVRDYGGVIMEIRGGNNGTWLSPYPQPPVNVTTWQHFMCIRDTFIDQNNQKVWACYQSWGASVGDNGVQYFNQNWLDSGNILDLFVLVPLVPVPTPTFWQKFYGLMTGSGFKLINGVWYTKDNKII